MALRLLRARDRGTERVLVVHLDDEKVDAQGRPDPDWVRVYRWGAGGGAGGADLSLAVIKTETKRLAQAELARMLALNLDDGAPLAGEGAAL